MDKERLLTILRIRRAKAIYAFVVIIFVGSIFATYFLTKFKSVPSEFNSARLSASLVAKDIVNLSSESAKNISNISQLNADYKYGEALELVNAEIAQNKIIRDKAISLSNDLGKMTQNIFSIRPESSARLALSAISIETELIRHLIIYNDYLNQLLDILRAKLVGQEWDKNKEINDLVKKINDEAKIVNLLNEEFNQKIGEFDKSAK